MRGLGLVWTENMKDFTRKVVFPDLSISTVTKRDEHYKEDRCKDGSGGENPKRTRIGLQPKDHTRKSHYVCT